MRRCVEWTRITLHEAADPLRGSGAGVGTSTAFDTADHMPDRLTPRLVTAPKSPKMGRASREIER